MKKNSKKQTSTATHDHPGRPRYEMKFPTRKEWTFTDLMRTNEVETNPKSKRFGKGPHCTMLTLRKNMEADMYLHKEGKPLISKNRIRVNPRSQVCLIDGVTAEPDSESGLGRRALLYCLRINKDSVSKAPRATSTPKATKAPRKAKATAPVSQTPTADALDKIHAALAAPDPAPAVVVPAVTITPEATPAPTPEVTPEATPATAEVAPTPEAPAPVAEPVATLANS